MASRFLVPYSTSRHWMSEPPYQPQREIDRVFDDVFSGSGGARRIEVRGTDAGGGQALTASVVGGSGAGSAASTAQGGPTAAPAGATVGTR